MSKEALALSLSLATVLFVFVTHFLYIMSCVLSVLGSQLEDSAIVSTMGLEALRVMF